MAADTRRTVVGSSGSRVRRAVPSVVIEVIEVLDDLRVVLLAGQPEGRTHQLHRGLALVVWRPTPPSGLPAHAIPAGRFTEVAGTVATALGAEVAGMSLAIGGGVDMPDGAHVANPGLEALIAGHPRPLFGSSRLMRSAARALAAHGVPLRPRSTAGGGTLLAPVGHR